MTKVSGLAIAGTVLGACNALWGVAGLRYDSAGSTATGGGGQSAGGAGGSGAHGGATTTSGSGGAATTVSTGGEGPLGGAGGLGGTGQGETLVVKALAGLSGDGFIANPDLCGDEVLDSYSNAPHEVIDVGRDPPCGKTATYRAYVRFVLPDLAGKTLASATLHLYYLDRAEPTAGVSLLSVDDFGTLEAGNWGLTARADLGTVLTIDTPADHWLSVAVDQPVQTALDLADSAVAFELRYQNEGEDPAGFSRWYEVVSADSNTDLGPELVLTLAGG